MVTGRGCPICLITSMIIIIIIIIILTINL